MSNKEDCHQDFSQPIKTNGTTRVVHHKTHVTLAGEQRLSDDTSCIPELECTARSNKGFLLTKSSPESKKVRHLASELTGLVENRKDEGQIITNAPQTNLPIAQGYAVNEDGSLKLDAQGNCILGPLPQFNQILIRGVNRDACIDGEPTTIEDPTWYSLVAPDSRDPLTLASAGGNWVLTSPDNYVEYYEEGVEYDLSNQFPPENHPLWLLPSNATDDEITLRILPFQTLTIDRVLQTNTGGVYTVDARKAIVTPDETNGFVTGYHVCTFEGNNSVTGTTGNNVINFVPNTGIIDENLFDEDTIYILNRTSGNTSDITLTRGGAYGGYDIRTEFTLLDSNTVSIPGGTDVLVYVSGGEIKLSPIGGSSSSSTGFATSIIGNLFPWDRLDAPPADKLIPVSGQTISNADVTYPDVWNDRNLIPAIASFDNVARTITMKNYNGEGRFFRGGPVPGVDQQDSTALPNNPFTGNTDVEPPHTHGVQQGPDVDGATFASPDAVTASLAPIQTLPAGAHDHTVNINGGGDAETRPVNTSRLICIIACPF